MAWQCLAAAMVTIVSLVMSDLQMTQSLEPILFNESVEPIRKAFVIERNYFIKE